VRPTLHTIGKLVGAPQARLACHLVEILGVEDLLAIGVLFLGKSLVLCKEVARPEFGPTRRANAVIWRKSTPPATCEPARELSVDLTVGVTTPVACLGNVMPDHLARELRKPCANSGHVVASAKL